VHRVLSFHSLAQWDMDLAALAQILVMVRRGKVCGMITVQPDIGILLVSFR